MTLDGEEKIPGLDDLISQSKLGRSTTDAEGTATDKGKELENDGLICVDWKRAKALEEGEAKAIIEDFMPVYEQAREKSSEGRLRWSHDELREALVS
jgi:hypothetical protein